MRVFAVLSGALENVHGTRGAESDNVRHAAAGAFDLSSAGLATEMCGDFEDVGEPGCAERMALGQQAPRRVDRDPAVALRVAPRMEEFAGASPGSQSAEVLVVEKLGSGEAVVQFDQVEVSRADAGALVGAVGGERAEAC